MFGCRRHRKQCICQDWNLGRFGKGRACACGWNLLGGDGDAGGAYACAYTAEAYAYTADADA